MSRIKRYLVFGCDSYYPGGGWNDFIIACSTLKEAREQKADAEDHKAWAEIIDLETLKEVK